MVLMSSYVGLHPISNTKTPTLILSEFYKDPLKRYGSLKAIHFCEPIFFSPLQVERCFISMAMTERSVQPTNQNVRQIKTMSATLQVLTGAR